MAKLTNWDEQIDNRTAPKGLPQTAEARKGYETQQPGFEDSRLGRYASEKGYVSQARSWYTGGNAEGTENGWDTDFFNKVIEDQDRVIQQGTFGRQFDDAQQNKINGIVTWDHTTQDGRTNNKFGDVYENGVKTGNVYDQFDKPTADLMMGQLLFNGKQQAKIFGASDREQRLGREVDAERRRRTADIPKQLAAAEFGDKVEKTEGEFDDKGVDTAIVGTAAVGTATLGAGVGSVFPVIGTTAGAIGGFVFGGVSAYLNKDQLTENAARAYEITSLARSEDGAIPGMFEGVEQWAGFAGKLISPASNTVQGLVDLTSSGGIGDGENAFYATDAEGDRKVSKLLRGADIVASTGDALLQFASPLGMGLYTTQMSAQIAGSTASLVATGKTFDDRRGGFDNIFTDDQGKFDPLSTAAGIGNIGIDVVQLGMARGLAGKTDAGRLAAGDDAVYNTGRIASRLPSWAGGQPKVVKEALAAGGKPVEAAGMRFILDAEGKVVSKRATLSLLAPSEQLTNISARTLARRDAVKRGTASGERSAVTADDIYAAAQSLSVGERKLTSAVVNGFGEGYEEGIQSVLEPLSHDGKIDGAQVFESFLYGGAMGAGMTMGTGARAQSNDSKMYNMANALSIYRNRGEISKRSWDSMDEVQKKAAASRSNLEDGLLRSVADKIVDAQEREQVAGTAGIQKVLDAQATQVGRELASASQRTDQAFVITQLEHVGTVDADGNPDAYSMPNDAIGSSATQLLVNMQYHANGMQMKLDQLIPERDAAAAQARSNPEDAAAAEKAQQLELQVADVDLIISWMKKIGPEVEAAITRINDVAADPDALRAEVVNFNQLMRGMFNESLQMPPEVTAADKRAIAKAVSIVYTRYPQDQAGSYPILVPQISEALTASQSDNVLQVSHALLSPISGDYDGDKIAEQAQLIIRDEDFTTLRAGLAYLGQGNSVNIGTPKYEKYLVEELSQALASAASSTLNSYATETLTSIGSAIRKRYDGQVDPKALDKVLSDFYKAVRANNPKAREVLLDGLAGNELGGQVTQFAMANLSNEWLWVDQLMKSKMQTFQEAYARHRPKIDGDVNFDRVAPLRQGKQQRERRIADAAVAASTMAMRLVGSDMFRMFQKLHYSSINSPVLSTEMDSRREEIASIAQFYESLGQNLTTTELENTRGKDEITRRVAAQLQRLVDGLKTGDADLLPPEAIIALQNLNGADALVVLGNLQVQDFDQQEDGSYKIFESTVSLTQLLLRRSVYQDQRDNRTILQRDEQLKAKHSRLIAMTRGSDRGSNAEQAFVEVFGSYQMYELLGDESGAFGPHLTVEQYVRQYGNQGDAARTRTAAKLKDDAAYLGKKQAKDMPYRLDQIGDVSPYRAVVDAVVAVGNGRISMNRDQQSKSYGKLSGVYAERNNRVSASLQDALSTANEALRSFLEISPRQEGETNEQVVGRMIEQNPDFAKRVFDLLPTDHVNAMFFVDNNGELLVSNWVYRLFTMSDPVEAEMYFYRNLLIAEWNSLGGDRMVGEEGSVEEVKGRQYGKLPKRMHRVLYQLAAASDNGLMAEKFWAELTNAKDLEAFMRWVNTTPGVRGNQAPIVAWFDDVAEFDPDKARGGWTTNLQGAELREAITALQAGSDKLVKSLAEEKISIKADEQVRAGIRRYVRYLKDPSSVIQRGDDTLYNAFNAAMDFAADSAVGLGPAAMVNQTFYAVMGINGKMHTKGQNPDHVRPAGLLDASRDGYDYVTPIERQAMALTSTGLDAIGSAMHMLAHDSVRTMDDYGRQVEWVAIDPEMDPKAAQLMRAEKMLDLLDDPDSRPLARAIMYPQVQEMTQDGQLSTQMLIGKDLKKFLDGSAFNDLFPKYDRLSTEAAMKYATVLEAQARKYGGHFSVQRMADELATARTSAATRALSPYELEQMTLKAYRDIVVVMQDVGSMAANEDAAADLADLMREAKEGQRLAMATFAMGHRDKSSTPQEVTDLVIEQFKTERETEKDRRLVEVADMISADPARTEEFVRLSDAIEADHQRFLARMDVLLSNDRVATVVDMFTIGTGQVAAQKKSELLNFIRTHRSRIHRVTDTKIVMQKLSLQLMDSTRAGQVDLTDAEWDVLSRAAIAVYLSDSASSASSEVGVPLFPDATSAKNVRYYDRTFGYLLDPLLAEDSPLLQAARDLHRRAGRHEVVSTKTDVLETLSKTIYEDWSYGDWTDDIVRNSIENNRRLDSSGAEPAIAISGNVPKRIAAMARAQSRTWLVPTPDMASKITLGIGDFMDPYSQVTSERGGQARTFDAIQLNNRLASSLSVTYADGTVVDLLPIVGRQLINQPETGIFEVSLSRIESAVVAQAAELGISADGMSVEMDFFHPDDQPADPEWMHNTYFEGTSFASDADRYDALIVTLMMSRGGISPEAQRMALDASKLGLPALNVIKTATPAERVAAEQGWQTDLAAVLRRKTRILMETNYGGGQLEAEMYNANHKMMKAKHFIIGSDADTGAPVQYTAEQVIAAQAAGTWVLPENPSLWIPTDEVLRTMYGDIMGQGVDRLTTDPASADLDSLPRWTGFTPQNLEMFGSGLAGERRELKDTRVAPRAHQSQLVVRSKIDGKRKDAYDLRMEFLDGRRAEAWAERANNPQFDNTENLRTALGSLANNVRQDGSTLDWRAVGVPFVGPSKFTDEAMAKMLLHELASIVDTEDGTQRTGWTYVHSGVANPGGGVLTQEALDNGTGRGGRYLAPDDLVVVQVDSFQDKRSEGEKALDFMMNNGGTVLLSGSPAAGSMRAELGAYMESRGYQRVPGMAYLFKAADTNTRFQNQRSRLSTLFEMRGVTRRNRVAIFNTTGLSIQENAAWVNADNPNLRGIGVTLNLVPTNAFADYNAPVESTVGANQIELVRQQLRGLDDPEGRAYLEDMAVETMQDARQIEVARAEFRKAWKSLMNRFDESSGTVLPGPGMVFGTGDIIPLVSSSGKVLLYRHGMKAPANSEVIREQQDRVLDGDSLNVAMYTGIREPNATTHTGEVVGFSVRNGYGLDVELNIPLSVFGNKMQLEWGGMKYVLTPRPESVKLPTAGFFPDWAIDIVSDADSSFSKESYEGLVDNHRNAFAFLGIDFLEDMTEFFFPGKGKDSASRTATRDRLRTIASSAPRIPQAAADELITNQAAAGSLIDMLAGYDGTVSWSDKFSQESVSSEIARAMIVYLMTPGARLEDVLRSGGFNDTEAASDSESLLMPSVFTQAFDQGSKALRMEMNRRFNQQLNNEQGGNGTYRLLPDFTFEITVDGSTQYGWLQFAEAHSSGDNPIKNAMTFDEFSPQSVSAHAAATAYLTTGSRTVGAANLKADALSTTGVTDLSKDIEDGGVWRMMTAIPEGDKSFQSWRMETPAEQARKDLARDAMIQFRVALDPSTDNGWRPNHISNYNKLAVAIVKELGLKERDANMVDGWVRQYLGKPAGLNEDGETSEVTGGQAVTAAEHILRNVRGRYSPVFAGEVPLMDVYDLQTIFAANDGKVGGWFIRESAEAGAAGMTKWDDVVRTSLGSALETGYIFTPLYTIALDGFMHTYQNATRELGALPVSLDPSVTEAMMDPKTNEMLLSLDPDVNQIISDPASLDREATLEELLGGRRMAGKYVGRHAPSSELAKRLKQRDAWYKENGIPTPKNVTMKQFKRQGADFVTASTNTTALARMLIDLRVGMALVNPALWISAGPEQMVRAAIDRVSNVATGQTTSGIGLAWRRELMERWLSTPEGNRNSVGQIMDMFGLVPVHDAARIRAFADLYNTMGVRSDFKSMIYGDLTFKRPETTDKSAIERGLGRFAKFGSSVQDPTTGVRANTLARRYVEAAEQFIRSRPTETTLSIDTLIAQLRRDPTYLESNFPEAHLYATNAVAQIRSIKTTPLAMALRGIYEPLSKNPNPAINLFGNVVLKLPLLFSGYAMNVVTSITGMQGISDAFAMLTDSREKTPFVRRIQSAMRGEEVSEYTDMSEVFEGIDLSRSFIRAGMTHTSLFALGLTLGGLGLSGEDDEERRRRRAAELQGGGVILDPRKVQNDFRNADALYWGGTPHQLPWMAKQFISPIIGMERFFDTGDPRQIMWGFQDAVGSFPIINSLMWNDALHTAQDFFDSAEEIKGEEDEDLMNKGNFLTRAVMSYEKMLFESAFVNQIYQAADDYDRDPYKQPMLDSSEVTQVDAQGEPRETDKMEPYVDTTGAMPVVKDGYIARRGASAELHSYTENRATLAGALSLFTGLGDSSFLRRNMAVKTRSFETTPLTDEQAELVIRAVAENQSGAALNLTPEEAMNKLRMAGVGGTYAKNSELEPIAKELSARSKAAQLSYVDKDGREKLNDLGARAVFEGLAKGSVKLGDPSLRGIHITMEQRQRINKEWAQDLVQEGIDMGLDETKANKRMQRLMQGDFSEPGSLGLADILYSKELSYTDKLEYNQLNTTYVTGPDGMPWATGFERSGMFNILGQTVGIKPAGQIGVDSGAMDQDGRFNSVDLLEGRNLGLRALEPVNEIVPTAEEIGKSIEKAIADAGKASYAPLEPFDKKSGGGGGFGRRSRGGGGGYSSGGGGGYFTRMNPFQEQRAPYGDGIPNINTGNPILRRADIRRERVWSERGRLKQWQ